MNEEKCYGKELLEKELKGSYLFFIRENNFDKNLNYGLIHDESKENQNVSSISSVGLGLCALVIGVIHGYLKYDEAFRIVNNTLDTVLSKLENINGFYYHFIDTSTGKRKDSDTEISIIDTALLACGAIVCGEFFEGEIKEKAEILYNRINWKWFLEKGKNQFYMGYSKELGHRGEWNFYGEQLILYILSIASPNYFVPISVYDSFKKPIKSFMGIDDIIYTYTGSLFAYQYSHAFIDFRNWSDKNGVDWFENSVKATKANRLYCISRKDKFKTFSENSWGLTSCLTPNGYKGKIGAMPCEIDIDKENDGTVATSGAIASIVFLPEESIKAMENYYNNFPELWSDYGFNNSYNLCLDKPWFANENFGIDKGVGMCMIENYLNGSIWKYFMKNKYVQKGMKILRKINTRR